MKTAFVLVAALVFFQAYSQHKESTIRETTRSFKTYPFSDPDPVARVGAIYPYFRFDGYTNTPVNKEWKVVELENEFIRVMILPEIGGKIWAAWDKTSGKPFIYYNQVVKFRDVAMRGPWTSGGIEANYGIIGHTPNCATPVDYLIEKKNDGSASCFVGTLDLLTQTYWTIEINLPADKAYFTTRSFWHNATAVEQPYYTWMNAGLPAEGELEFIYPGNRYLGHNGEFADWEISRENGKNISFYEQNNFGEYKSYHVFGSYTEFFGAYWHRDDFGMARYSYHDEKPGKKIWIWGLSGQGMIWEKLLTDSDGQYVEVQSGRMFNQASEGSTFTPFKNKGFQPTQSDSWTEYWFPVKGTKGFVEANPFGALNIRKDKGFLKISFSPLQDFSDEIKILEARKVIYSRKPELRTLKTFSDSIAFSGNEKDLTVTIGDTKMSYSSNPARDHLNRPVLSPENFNWNSAYGLYLQGKDNIQRRYYPQAEEKFTECLKVDPNYLPALADMAMLMYMKMDYEKSLSYATHALSINTYDPAANYYYGLANAALGKTVDAKDGFDIAALSTEVRGAAFTQLARLYAAANDYGRAIHYAQKALEVNSGNIDVLQIMSLAHRLSGDEAAAKESLADLKKLNPLNHFVRFEEFRLQPSENNRTKFISMIRNEMAHETFLELASWYRSLGQFRESLEVLNLATPNAEIYYWMAFLKTRAGDAGASELIKKANDTSPLLVFPFRPQSTEVFDWVIGQTDHWAPRYYLGLLYWSKNRKERAKQLFNECGEPNFAPFYASRALLMKDSNYEADLRKALALDPSQWRYGRMIADHLMEKKKFGPALEVARRLHSQFPRDFRTGMLLARTLLANKQYDASLEILKKIDVLPAEGSTDGRQLYREAWLMKAVQQLSSKNFKSALSSIKMAGEWPENLGAGKPYDEDIDARVDNYLEGLCYERMGQPQKAAAKWNEVASFPERYQHLNTLATALALRKLNREADGRRLLEDWVAKAPQNDLAKWCLQTYNGVTPTVEFTGSENFKTIMEFISR